MTDNKEVQKEPERCKMVSYDGFWILAGIPPEGAVKTQCEKPAVRDGFCEDCHFDNW